MQYVTWMTSAVTDTRVEPSVEQINREIDAHEHRHHDHHQRLDHVVVFVKYGFDQQPAKTVKVEDLLGDDKPPP